MSATPETTKAVESTNEDPTTEKEPSEELSDDEIFHLLQVKRRRDTLRYLQSQDGSAKMRDVTEQVAAWENNTTVADLTSNERQRVYISLYQSHLPKLDEEGVINYDQSRGDVKMTPAAEQLKPYLDVAGTRTGEDTSTDNTPPTGKQLNLEAMPWMKVYQSLTLVSFTGFLGVWANISPFTAIGLQLWTMVVIMLFGVLSATQMLANS